MAESDFSGSFPHDLLDLRDWRWQGPVKSSGELGTEGDGKAISVPDDESDTTKITTFRDDPWFVLVDDDTTPYVRLRAPAKGATTGTSSSSTTRSELREMHFPERARKSSWDATKDAVHNLKARLAVMTVMQNHDGKLSRVAVAQVHKTSEDGIIVYVDGASGKLRWKQDSVVQPGPLVDYTLGEYVDIGLSVHGGLCTIYVDDVPKVEGKLTGSSATTCYFKTGCYNQDNSIDDYPDDAVNEVRIAAVRVAHDTPWTPGGYTPVGPGVTTTRGLGPGTPGHAQKPCDLLDFAGPHQAWKLTLDVDDNGHHDPGKKADEKSATELARGFVHPGHFEVVEDGTAVRFRSHLDGATTKPPSGSDSGGSHYPRTELREMQPDNPGEEASWTIAKDDHTTRRLTAQVQVTHAPATPGHQGVVIGQIHLKKPDKDLLELMYDGNKKAVGYRWNGHWQGDDLLIERYTPDDGYFTYRIEVRAGTVRMSVDTGDGFQEKAVQNNVSADTCYFKAGAYTQSHADTNGPEANDYGEALFRSITVETKH